MGRVVRQKAGRAALAVGFVTLLSTIATATAADAADGSQGESVGLGPSGQMLMASLIVFLVALAIVALAVHRIRRNLFLEMIIRIAAGAAILLVMILVIAGILVDQTIKHELSWQYAFLLSLVTIVLGISGVIVASLYRSKWVEGPVR